ncbi:MAG: LysR family transcriptional regulator [Pseudonocardiales bacterium]|nr:MAG: LysR family transcriptional regulator [Pseudonocardiales bacterium]
MPNDGAATLDVGRLRLLREVGLRGTIAGAARSLGLTSSAVSQQLTVLEREAGIALIDRSPRGVVLTGAGRLLAARAGEVLDVLTSARADLERIGGAMAGPVSVASVASAAATFVSAAVTEMRGAHPDISLGVTAAEPSRALRLLVAGDVDLAVVDEYDYVPLALPDFVVVRELCTEPLVALGPAGSFGRRRPALAELAMRDWVMPPDDAACGLAVRSACRAEGFEPRVRWETDDMLLLVRAVAAGHGVAVLPRLSVADEMAEVEVRPLREPVLERRLIAVARASAMGRPVVGTVLDALVLAAKHTLASQKRHFAPPSAL